MKNLIHQSLAAMLCAFHLFMFLGPCAYAQERAAVIPNEALPDIVKRVLPSVVNIQTDRSFIFGYGHRARFTEQFFIDFFETGESAGRTIICQSEGAGVVIDSSGLVLTNEHVIADAENIRVILSDKKSRIATVIGKNKKEDLALLQIEGEGIFLPIVQGDSDAVSAGSDVFAIGTPYGYSQSVTKGIVSATNRQLKEGDKVLFDHLIQTDAAVNPGNSGGPLLRDRHEINESVFE